MSSGGFAATRWYTPVTLAPLFHLLPFNFQAAFLKQRQDELLKEQWELDQLESERKQREEGRKKQEHGYVDAIALAGQNRKGNSICFQFSAPLMKN